MDAAATPPHQGPDDTSDDAPDAHDDAVDAVDIGPLDPWGHLEPWDRQPGEAATQYSQFLAYRDLGRTRTVPKTAVVVERSAKTLHKTAHKQRWRERATAWDSEIDRTHRELMAEQRRVVSEQHLQIARAMLAKAVDRIRTLKPETMTVSELARFIESASRLQRLALGEPTENVAHSGTVDVHTFTDLSPAQQDARLAELHREIERRRETNSQTPTHASRAPQDAASPPSPSAASTAPPAPTLPPSQPTPGTTR